MASRPESYHFVDDLDDPDETSSVISHLTSAFEHEHAFIIQKAVRDFLAKAHAKESTDLAAHAPKARSPEKETGCCNDSKSLVGTPSVRPRIGVAVVTTTAIIALFATLAGRLSASLPNTMPPLPETRVPTEVSAVEPWSSWRQSSPLSPPPSSPPAPLAPWLPPSPPPRPLASLPPSPPASPYDQVTNALRGAVGGAVSGVGIGVVVGLWFPMAMPVEALFGGIVGGLLGCGQGVTSR